MGVLDLEAAKGGPFVFQHGGASHVLPSPTEMSLEDIVRGLRSQGRSFIQIPMPLWKVQKLTEAWAKHYDLGTPNDVDRLLYLLERYERHIEFDLRAHAGGANLRELWQSRQWRLLFNLIDHLPRHSYYSDAVSNDEEHAKMLAKAQAARAAGGEDSKPYSPPMTQFTPEVAAIADAIDAINGVRHAIIMANSDPKKSPPKAPDPYPRPVTALMGATQRAKFELRKKKHESLVARLLPHKKADG